MRCTGSLPLSGPKGPLPQCLCCNRSRKAGICSVRDLLFPDADKSGIRPAHAVLGMLTQFSAFPKGLGSGERLPCSRLHLKDSTYPLTWREPAVAWRAKDLTSFTGCIGVNEPETSLHANHPCSCFMPHVTCSVIADQLLDCSGQSGLSKM